MNFIYYKLDILFFFFTFARQKNNKVLNKSILRRFLFSNEYNISGPTHSKNGA